MRRAFCVLAVCVISLALAQPSFAITRTWTGAMSGSWSNPLNWSPQAIPSAGDSLVFPNNAVTTVMTNDLPAGTSVGPMTFNTAYSIHGNDLTITGDMTATTSGTVFVIGLKIGGAIVLESSGTYSLPIDVNGQTVTMKGYASIASLNGSGTVNIRGSSHISFGGDGTFNGTINGSMTVNGSMPNANVTTDWDNPPSVAPAQIIGIGTMGNLTVNPGGELNPGPIGSAGVLHTKSLSINAVYNCQLAAFGAFDSVQVTGTVSLNGYLFLSIISGSPSAGETYKIIDNDGTDPVAGTFTGPSSAALTEGATFDAGTSTFQISYKGGDGNDVVLTVVSATKTWNGLTNANWSNPQNWFPHAIPVAGEPLLFPSGAANTAMTNDLPAGMTVGAMTFKDAYTLNGNALTLMGNVTSTAFHGLTCNVALKVGGPIVLDENNGPYTQPIDVNGQTLIMRGNTSVATLNGTGTVNIRGQSNIAFPGDGAFSGIINGPMAVNGSMPNANATADWDVPPSIVPATISGTGTLGNVTLNSGELAPGGALGVPGVLHTKSLVLHNAFMTMDLLPSGASDAVQITGTVLLDGFMAVGLPSGAPAVAQSFTIIDNDGNDPVTGTFLSAAGTTVTAIAEGRTFSAGNSVFRITYVGGDGNDVVLTTVGPTATTLTQTPTTTNYGDPFTATASVTSIYGTPMGSVTFHDGSAVVATVALQNGVSTWTSSSLEPGSHNITATFAGTGIFADSTSAGSTHAVQLRPTTSTVNQSVTTSHYGDNVTFTAIIAPIGTVATPVGGTVSFESDGAAIGTTVVTSGNASVLTPLLSTGIHSIVAKYAGDLHFASSVSGGVSVSIAKAQSDLSLKSLANPSTAGAALLKVVIHAVGHPEIVPAGKVRITEHGLTVGEETLNGGEAIVQAGPLSAGNHELVASFAGDSNFEPASGSLTQSVLDAQLSISSVAVNEGDSGSRFVRLLVQLSGSSSKPTTVSYATMDGNARAGMDYEFTSGTVTFAAGEIGKLIDVRIFGDLLSEPDQTFLVVLSNATNAGIGNGVGSVTLLNDDGPVTTPPRQRPARH